MTACGKPNQALPEQEKDNFAKITSQPSATVIDYSGKKANSSLGNEADISFKYAVMKDVNLLGGYSQMFADKSMRYVKNILPGQSMKAVQNWIWLSININPDILIYKTK